MIFFYGLSIFILIGSLIPAKKQGFYIFLVFIILFLTSAFRGVSVGTDTINYELTFNSLSNGIDWVRGELEPGWIFLNDVVIFFNGDFHDLLLLSSLLTLVPVFYSSIKYSYNPILSLVFYYLLYFYFYSFNITRQSIAISFILLAWCLLLKDSRKLFLFFVVIASFFHFSALICLPMLFLNKMNFSRFNMQLIVLCSMVVGLFGVEYILYFVTLTSYSEYIYEYQIGNFIGNAFILLVYNFIFFIVLFSMRDQNINLKIFFIFIVLLNLMVRFPFGNRILMYFSIYQIIFYPYFISQLKFISVDFRIACYIFFILCAYFIFMINIGSGGIFPYTNILL